MLFQLGLESPIGCYWDTTHTSPVDNTVKIEQTLCFQFPVNVCSILPVLSTGCNWDISPVDNTVKVEQTLTVFSISI